jgi:hypothetical protein
MRHFAKYLVLIAGMTACDSATKGVAPDSEQDVPAIAAAAQSSVDPTTLIPEPPNAVCWTVGTGSICHTQLSFPTVNDPVLQLTCGTVYQTGSDIRHGIRWYNSENKLVKRSFTLTANAIWSLSPEGTGPTVTVTDRENVKSEFAVPGDLSSEFGGSDAGIGVRVQAPGFGVILHVAGLSKADETFHGIFITEDDPAVAARLCAALTR